MSDYSKVLKIKTNVRIYLYQKLYKYIRMYSNEWIHTCFVIIALKRLKSCSPIFSTDGVVSPAHLFLWCIHQHPCQWCYPNSKRKRKDVEIFSWNWIKAAAERIYFQDDSIKWQLWHNIKVQKYRLEMRQDCASNLSQSATDWTQNYGELGGRESIMWEGRRRHFGAKKS